MRSALGDEIAVQRDHVVVGFEHPGAEILNGGCAALVGDVDLLDPELEVYRLSEDMRDRAHAGGAVGNSLATRARDVIVERGDPERRLHEQRGRRTAQIGDVREVGHRIVGEAVELRRRDGEGGVVAEDQGRAVRVLVGHVIGGDGAAGAGPVVHHGLLSVLAVQILGEDARDQIAGAAGREGDDDAHGFVGPGAGLGVEGRGEDECGGAEGDEAFHGRGDPLLVFEEGQEGAFADASCRARRSFRPDRTA